MSRLLDTNSCIRYLNDRNSKVAVKIAAMPPQDIYLCDIVKGELYFGAYRSNRQAANLGLLRLFFAQFLSLPFDDKSADIFGRIRAQLRAAGTPIGPYDLQIAAIALANNLILVTHNTREFSRVAGLALDDWE